MAVTTPAQREKSTRTCESHTFATVPQSLFLRTSHPTLLSFEHKGKVLLSQGHAYPALISRTPVLSLTEGLNLASNHVMDIRNPYKHTGRNTVTRIWACTPAFQTGTAVHSPAHLPPPPASLIAFTQGLGSWAHPIPLTLKTGFP